MYRHLFMSVPTPQNVSLRWCESCKTSQGFCRMSMQLVYVPWFEMLTAAVCVKQGQLSCKTDARVYKIS